MQEVDERTPALIVGKRTNVNMSVVAKQAVYLSEDVESVARAYGQLFREDAIDYFFIKRNVFPWHRVPGVAIGRRAYDNFIVGIGILNKVTVVDATRTVVAVHQTDFDGIGAGSRNPEQELNVKAIGRFDYSLGVTTRCKYFTQFYDVKNNSKTIKTSNYLAARSVDVGERKHLS
jgi:hypothetical protein